MAESMATWDAATRQFVCGCGGAMAAGYDFAGYECAACKKRISYEESVKIKKEQENG